MQIRAVSTSQQRKAQQRCELGSDFGPEDLGGARQIRTLSDFVACVFYFPHWFLSPSPSDIEASFHCEVNSTFPFSCNTTLLYVIPHVTA